MSTRESTDHQQDDAESISNLSHTTGSTLQLVALEPTKAESSSSKKRGVISEKRALHDFTRLLDSVPQIAENFEIVEKIGEGTFSSVYLAHLKGFSEHHYALKHLVPTSSPLRIENEIKCLQLLQGKENVISLLTMVRHYDQVVLVMPYFMHEKFADYLPSMTLVEARDYMNALFAALANVHFHHIIHRDIKPSNFLYNREKKKFQLVDFGLAHFEVGWEEQCNGPVPLCSGTGAEEDSSPSPASPSPSLGFKPKQRTNPVRADRKERVVSNGATHLPPHTYQRQIQHKMAAKNCKPPPPVQTKGETPCRQCTLLHGHSEVCDHCMERPNQIAPRAGTPGFRAPEVLFKCPKQSTAVDIWSAGVILLCLLSGKYPFFKAHDDLTALAQVIGLLGSKRCAQAAEACGKELSASPEIPACNLRTLCQSLRASLVSQDLNDARQSPVHHRSPLAKQDSCNDDLHKGACTKRLKLAVEDTPTKPNGTTTTIATQQCSKEGVHSGCHGVASCHGTIAVWGEVPQSAYDLLHRCLDLDPFTRITATEALKHPFMADKLPGCKSL